MATKDLEPLRTLEIQSAVEEKLRLRDMAYLRARIARLRAERDAIEEKIDMARKQLAELVG